MTPIRFRCPCGQPIGARPDRSGDLFRCPRCGRLREVPRPGPAAATEPEATTDYELPTDFLARLRGPESLFRAA